MTVEDAFTITGRGVVVVGPFVGDLPHVNSDLALSEGGRQRATATCAGIEMITRLVDGHRRTGTRGVLLAGVDRSEVRAGQTLSVAP
jgi:translation elongation factor EF-Tu-like GTPase